MATLHTHTPAALCRPVPLMHNTHACTTPALAPACTWSIEAVTPTTLRETSVFVNASRKELFPSLGYDALLDNPGILDGSCVLVARDESRAVVAAMAYIPFDYRFPRLPWPVGIGLQGVCDGGGGIVTSSSSCSTATSTTANSSSSSLVPSDNPYPISTQDGPPFKIVEVVRLFVLPQYRRLGLAASLFSRLRDHAVASGVQCMYLHTHPFLPGAIRFWEKQGFDVIHKDEEDYVWQTHHMQMMLGSGKREQGTRGE